MENTFSPRKAALVAGFVSLIMFVAAMVAEMMVRQALIVPGNARETAENVLAHPGLFRLGILGYLVVLVCDVLAAWALYVFLRPVNGPLSLLAACFRWIYTAIFALALFELVSGFRLLMQINTASEQAMFLFNGFDSAWAIALVFFSVHLLLLGRLVYSSGFIPRVWGILLLLAGAAYLVDNLAKLLLPGYEDYQTALTIAVAIPSIAGELGLAIWLLVKGGQNLIVAR